MEKLPSAAAKTLIASILQGGTIGWSYHALKAMKDDDLTTGDILNVLRGGVVDPPEPEHGSWRYRVRTPKITVVVAFESEEELIVVTAWRNKTNIRIRRT